MGSAGVGGGVARVVRNHSAMMEGLERVLGRLAEGGAGRIKTLVPGRIARTRGHVAAKRMILRVTAEVSGGWKMVARRGSTAQEVFAVTCLTKEGLQAIAREAVAKARH